jgi:polyhydroxyalkanoate synthesis regulator phasin
MEPTDIPYLVLGAMSTTRSEMKKTVDELIEKGRERFEKQQEEATQKRDEATKKGEAYISELVGKGRNQQEELMNAVAKEVQRILGSMGVVTKADLKKINDKVAKLEKKVSEV